MLQSHSWPSTLMRTRGFTAEPNYHGKAPGHPLSTTPSWGPQPALGQTLDLSLPSRPTPRAPRGSGERSQDSLSPRPNAWFSGCFCPFRDGAAPAAQGPPGPTCRSRQLLTPTALRCGPSARALLLTLGGVGLGYFCFALF